MDHQSPGGSCRRLVLGLHALALLLLALHLYVRTLPPTPTPLPSPQDAEAAWWGLWPVTYAPGLAVAVGATAWLIFAGWLWWMEWRGTRRIPPPCPLPWLAGISLALVTASVLFPIAHTRWGDAYILSKSIAWPDPALRLTHSWQAPLDVYLHSRVWHWFFAGSGEASGDAVPVYRLLSPLAGLLYLAVALALSRDRRLAPGWLTFGLLASLGLLQLFFGYVENYSFAAAGVLAYLWLGLRTLEGRSPLWLASLALALTNATHPSTVVLAPSLLYCGWRCMDGPPSGNPSSGNQKGPSHVSSGGTFTTRGRLAGRGWWTTFLAIAIPMALVATGTVLLMEWGGHGLAALLTTDRPGGSDARWFVPLWQTETRWEHYTLFSWLHLRDWLNEQLLVAPVVMPALAWLALAAPHRRPKMGSTDGILPFLLVATVSYQLFTWVWNPDYGGQRDWDLFSLAALPTALLLAHLAQRRLPDPWYRWMGMAPLLFLQALHTAAWIYQNTLPWAWPK
ncbi:MAG: hypothetical protein KatS3mg050_1605 [Litorilinea sp.]|nr:MAG: hypothetical protein KatS3mg050_1605 [Litorilinea sp.]